MLAWPLYETDNFEVITLVQTNKQERFPVVSVGGKAFRGHPGEFMRDTMLNEGVISLEDTEFIRAAETAEDAVPLSQDQHAGLLSSAPDLQPQTGH